LRSGDLAGHSVFPLREITRAWNISLRTLIAIPAVWAQSVWFQQDGATGTMFRKWILQLKCFEMKLMLAINSLKKIVHFSFYFNLKIVRYFCRTLCVEDCFGCRRGGWRGGLIQLCFQEIHKYINPLAPEFSFKF
jgi:hypothetical protein